MDYYTKWAEACALPTKEAEGVATFLYSLICRHGVPKKVQSDQGREFVNSLNDQLFKLTGVKHIISTAYHPQTNGLDERFNQTLQRSLLKLVHEDESKWDRYLDSVLFAYRTSKQASTKYSPFYLMYGREPRLPIDLIVTNQVYLFTQQKLCAHIVIMIIVIVLLARRWTSCSYSCISRRN